MRETLEGEMDMPPRNKTGRTRTRRAEQLDAFTAPRASSVNQTTRRTLSAGRSPRATSRTGQDLGRYSRSDFSREARGQRLAALATERRGKGVGAYRGELRREMSSFKAGKGGIRITGNGRSRAYEYARYH